MQCLLIVTLCVEILVGLFAKFIGLQIRTNVKNLHAVLKRVIFAVFYRPADFVYVRTVLAGDFCNYESKIYRISDQRIISKLKIFTSQNRALKNPRSISKNVNKYAAAVLSSQQVAVLETNQNSNARLLRHRSPKFRKSDARVIKFRYFTTSPDSNIFVCCNDVSNCLYSMPRMRQPVFYRWHRSSFECKEKLEKILFYVTATKTSRSKSLVAIDDIQIFYSKSHPEYWKAGFNVCEAKYVTSTSASTKANILPIRTTALRENYTAKTHLYYATTTPTVDEEDDDYDIVIVPKDWINN